MQKTEIISISALGISIISITLSAYGIFRDRGRLRTKSIYYSSYEGRLPSMMVEAVNIGRRPVILKLLGGYYANGCSSGICIGDYKKGIRLGENEKFSEQIDFIHNILKDPEDAQPVMDLRFEDTVGNRYRIKNVKKNLEKLLNYGSN